MAKSQASFAKKEKEKKRLEKRKEKEQRMAERKANQKDGQSWEDMLAYVDENGNITNTPPDPSKKKVIKEEDIVLGARNNVADAAPSVRQGRVLFFNTSKGYGFIKDDQSMESIFVHANGLQIPLKDNDRVSFETERGAKGLVAVNVRRI